MTANTKHIQILLNRIERGESCFKGVDEETDKELTAVLKEHLVQLKENNYDT